MVEQERFVEQAVRDRLAARRRQVALGAAAQNLAARGIVELQAKAASGTPLALDPVEIAALLKVGVDVEGRGFGEERDSKYTKIIVNFGHHRYPSEPCGCKCAACASCHGEGHEEHYDAMELEGGGDPLKLN